MVILYQYLDGTKKQKILSFVPAACHPRRHEENAPCSSQEDRACESAREDAEDPGRSEDRGHAR